MIITIFILAIIALIQTFKINTINKDIVKLKDVATWYMKDKIISTIKDFGDSLPDISKEEASPKKVTKKQNASKKRVSN